MTKDKQQQLIEKLILIFSFENRFYLYQIYNFLPHNAKVFKIYGTNDIEY